MSAALPGTTATTPSLRGGKSPHHFHDPSADQIREFGSSDSQQNMNVGGIDEIATTVGYEGVGGFSRVSRKLILA